MPPRHRLLGSLFNWSYYEDPLSLARLDQPMTSLHDLTGLVVIDEIQRRSKLFSVLLVLVDRTPPPAHYLILGGASPALMRQSSESLAALPVDQGFVVYGGDQSMQTSAGELISWRNLDRITD